MRVIDAGLAALNGIAGAMLVLRGRSLVGALVIFGCVTLMILLAIVSAIGGQAGVIFGIVFLLLTVVAVVAARRSEKRRVVEAMAGREPIDREPEVRPLSR